MPASLGAVQPGSPHALPSPALWLLLKLLLAAEKSPAGRGLGEPAAASTKPVCAAQGGSLPLLPPPQPGCQHCPARRDGVGSRPPARPQPPQQSWSPQPRPAALEIATARETTQPGIARNEILFLSPLRSQHGTHESFSTAAHSPIRRKHNSSVYFTTVRTLPFLHSTGVSLFRVNTNAQYGQHGHSDAGHAHG